MYNSVADNSLQRSSERRNGFTLMEVVSALAVLAFMSVTTMTIVKQAMTAAADTSIKMNALEVARENMEKMLSATKVKEGAEYGESEKYPSILWETVVENFPEPVSQRMWVRVISSAMYVDSNDVEQHVQLTHWITSVSKDQLLQIMAEEQQYTDPLDPGNTNVGDRSAGDFSGGEFGEGDSGSAGGPAGSGPGGSGGGGSSGAGSRTSGGTGGNRRGGAYGGGYGTRTGGGGGTTTNGIPSEWYDMDIGEIIRLLREQGKLN